MNALRSFWFLFSMLVPLGGCYFNEKGDVVRHFVPEDGAYERTIGMLSERPTSDYPSWYRDLVPVGSGILWMDTAAGTVSIRVTECASLPCEDIETPSSAMLARLVSEKGMSFTIERKVMSNNVQRYGWVDSLALTWGPERRIPTAEALDAEWQEGP